MLSEVRFSLKREENLHSLTESGKEDKRSTLLLSSNKDKIKDRILITID